MPSIALDSGPAYALFDKSDKHHDRAVALVRGAKPGSFVTNIAVITEVAYLLGGQAPGFLAWVHQSARIDTGTPADLPRIREFMLKYRDSTPDFADASLVAMCERLNIRSIATIDVRDFAIYRTRDGKRLTIAF